MNDEKIAAIVAAIDRNTEAVKLAADRAMWQRRVIAMILVAIPFTLSCPRAKAAPLVSDGDKIASIGTVPEPGTWWMVVIAVGMLVCFFVVKHVATSSIREWELGSKKAARYRLALEDIVGTITDAQGLKRIARTALEE